MTSGKLTITIEEARLTRDTETFSKMDPYCVFQLREHIVRTKTITNAGKTPKWNETFSIDVKYIGDDFTITVKDEDIGSDDIVGIGQGKISAMCVPGGIDEWYVVSHKGKNAGQVRIRSAWAPIGGMGASGFAMGSGVNAKGAVDMSGMSGAAQMQAMFG
jgi:Ca2+-dependent lipid-binding protein